jgi:RNA polymerase sigma-70 factor (ECF subfamily)
MNVENHYVNEQVLRDVRKMMNKLPPTQREVVFMRFYQEMSFKEIAEATGVSINTSLGRMRYAILNLRRMAKEHKIELALQC